jgi:hypothetical protein
MTLAIMHPRQTHRIHAFVEHVRDLVVVVVEDKEKDRKTLFAADRDSDEVPSLFFSFLPVTTSTTILLPRFTVYDSKHSSGTPSYRHEYPSLDGLDGSSSPLSSLPEARQPSPQRLSE